MTFLNLVSDAGDSAVLLPLALLLIGVLWRYQSWEAASTLVAALAACTGVIVMLKLAFIACVHTLDAGVASPSGHAGMSAAVYGALGIIAASQTPRWQRPAVVIGSWLLIACIAFSRVAVGAHSFPEIALGLLVGAAALALFAWRYFKLRRAPLNLPIIAPIVLATVIAAHGLHLPMEALIHDFALIGRTTTGLCAAP